MSRRWSTLLAVPVLFSAHGSGAARLSQGESGLDEKPHWLVSGRVLEVGTGRSLEGVRAAVLYRRTPYAWMIGVATATTNAEGRFGYAVSFADTHILYASEIEAPNLSRRKGERPRLGQVYRPLAVTGPAGSTTECTVALGPAAVARVSVTDGEGRSVSGATIVAISEDAPHPIQLVDGVQTDEAGRAEFFGLGEGKWRLFLCKRGVGVASLDLPDVKWGTERDLTARLGPSGEIFLAVRLGEAPGNPDLEPLSKAMIEVFDERGRLVSAGPVLPIQWGIKSMDVLPRSSHDPAFIFSGCYAPGRYRVVVRHPKPPPRTTQEFVRDLVEVSEEVVVEAGKETRARLTLPLASAR